MICIFCKNDMIERKEECSFCDKGCALCNNTGKLSIVQCTNENCYNFFEIEED